MSEVSYTYGDPLLPEVEEAIAKAKKEGEKLRVGDVITMQLEALDERDRQQNMKRRVAESVYAHYEPWEYEGLERIGWACTNTDEPKGSRLFCSSDGFWRAYSHLPGNTQHDFDNGDEGEIYRHVLSVFEAAGGIIDFAKWKHFKSIVESGGISTDDWLEDYCDCLPWDFEEGDLTTNITQDIINAREERERRARAKDDDEKRRQAWEKKKEQLAAEAQAPREKPVRMYKGKPLHNRNA